MSRAVTAHPDRLQQMPSAADAVCSRCRLQQMLWRGGAIAAASGRTGPLVKPLQLLRDWHLGAELGIVEHIRAVAAEQRHGATATDGGDE
jgi:hypothetical protein